MTLRRHRTLEFTTDENEYDWVWAEQEARREQRQEAEASAALYSTAARDVVALPAPPPACGCGITPGMTYEELRGIAAAGSCTHPYHLCPRLDDALRKARKREAVRA